MILEQKNKYFELMKGEEWGPDLETATLTTSKKINLKKSKKQTKPKKPKQKE